MSNSWEREWEDSCYADAARQYGDWKGAVMGHLCDGLARLQEAGGGCDPLISPTGRMVACHRVNTVAIRHCPMCGERLGA